MSDERKVFLARAGKLGEDEDFALENNLAIIGFREVPSLEKVKDYDAVFKLVEAALPGAKARAVGNFAGQLGAFALAMKKATSSCCHGSSPRKSQLAAWPALISSAKSARSIAILGRWSGCDPIYPERHSSKIYCIRLVRP